MVRTPGRSNISHLGKRKIIFKMPFFGGYVSSLEGNNNYISHFDLLIPSLNLKGPIIYILQSKPRKKGVFNASHVATAFQKFRIPALEHRHQQRHAWGTPTCLAIQDLNDSGGSGHRRAPPSCSEQCQYIEKIGR